MGLTLVRDIFSEKSGDKKSGGFHESSWYDHLRAATENLEDLGMACHLRHNQLLRFSLQNQLLPPKEFEQRLAMVICHKLYNSIFQERLWVSILVHDSIRRWILWLFTSTICIPKHQIHATCGGIILPKQQHKKEMLSFNQTLFIFGRGILPLPLLLTPLRYPCSLHLPMWPRPCPPAAPPIALPTAPALPTALLPALPAALLLVSAARLMAPTAQDRRASHQIQAMSK